MLLSVVRNAAWKSIRGRRDLLLDEVFRCLLFVMVALGLALWFLALSFFLILLDLGLSMKVRMPRASTTTSCCS